VSPPNLPTPEFFIPLGRLLEYVRGGHRLVPVHADDIRAGACVRGWGGVRWVKAGGIGGGEVGGMGPLLSCW
jgi:hypothetical protein